MKKKNLQLNKFHQFLNDEISRKESAKRISAKICLANQIAKLALNSSSRNSALNAKANLVSHAITKFGEYFKVLSYTFHQELGILLKVRLTNKKAVLIPLGKLSQEGQAIIDLSFLKLQTNLLPPKKRQQLFEYQSFGARPVRLVNRSFNLNDANQRKSMKNLNNGTAPAAKSVKTNGNQSEIKRMVNKISDDLGYGKLTLTNDANSKAEQFTGGLYE